MNESEYYQGVVDCCKLLIQEHIKNRENIDQDLNLIRQEIYIRLEKIELELESRVPRFSPLYSALKLDKEASINQANYWEGIRDTTNLIRNYVSYRNNNYTFDEYEKFLEEILLKSSQKLEPKTSPLMEKLGIDFNKELPRKVESHQISKIENEVESNFDNSEGMELVNDQFSDEQPFSDDRNQNFADNRLEESKVEEDSDEMIELALEELNRENTISNLRTGLLSQINNEISKIDTPIEQTLHLNEKKEIPIVELSSNNVDEEKETKSLFSTSLKDALKMLKSDEDDDINDY